MLCWSSLIVPLAHKHSFCTLILLMFVLCFLDMVWSAFFDTIVMAWKRSFGWTYSRIFRKKLWRTMRLVRATLTHETWASPCLFSCFSGVSHVLCHSPLLWASPSCQSYSSSSLLSLQANSMGWRNSGPSWNIPKPKIWTLTPNCKNTSANSDVLKTSE